MKKTILFTLGAAALLASSFLSHASLVGLNQSPLGSHGSSTISYGYWDTFAPTNGSFSNAPAGFDSAASATNLTSGTLSLTGSGVATGGGDRYYDAGASTAWTISLQTGVSVQSAVLQVKITTPGSLTLSTFYSPVLNSLTASSVAVSASPVDVPNSQTSLYLVTYTWSNLSIAPSTPITVNFGNSVAQQHVSVDAIALDLSSGPVPAPEPSSLALLAVAAGFALNRMRRRSTSIRVA